MSPEIEQIVKRDYGTIAIINATEENIHTNICWNTGEEKNCHACYLSKGCKAKT